MLHTSFRLGLVALVALVALGGVAIANANSGQAGAIVCGVSTVTDRGMMSVEGVVQSPTALSGEYRFSLKSNGNGGSSNISQGGAFAVEAGASRTLGKVMVNAGSTLNVDFQVTAGGKNYDCSQALTART